MGTRCALRQAAGYANPLRCLQVFGGQHVLLRERMMFRHRQQHHVVEHPRAVQIRVIGRRRFAHQGDVQTALTQAFQLIRRRLAVERDMQIVPGRAEDFQRVGQYRGVHGVFDIADAQPAFFPATQPLAQRFQACGVGEQGLGFGEEGAAIHCQTNTLLATLEQVQAKELFQLGNLSAQR